MAGLRVPDDMASLVRKLPPGIKRKVGAALAAILDDPEAGKALKNEFEGLPSYRVGCIRITCRKGAAPPPSSLDSRGLERRQRAIFDLVADLDGGAATLAIFDVALSRDR